MRELGYFEGKNLTIEWRFAEGHYDRIPNLAAELVKSDVEVIVCHATPTALALQRATKSIPIVFMSVSEPVGNRLVTSLARPGANITGLSNFTIDISPKLVQFLREVVPKVSRIALLVNPDNPYYLLGLKNVEAAAKPLNITILPIEVRNREEIERGFASVMRSKPEAILVMAEASFIDQRKLITQLALTNHLPSIFQTQEEVLAGGLLSYGPNLPELFRGGADYVDKILNGATPRDLPVGQPRVFDLVVNMKTARSLGVTIPQSILLRADRVID